MSCCGLNNGCNCNQCQGVKMSQFAQQARAASGQLIVLSDNTLLAISKLVAFLKLQVIGLTSASFDTTTTTAALGHANLYACTDTSAPRTLTISSADIAMGLPTVPWLFDVKDEGGSAGTNKITIDTEGTELIDGVSSVEITADYGAIRLYSNGTNLFTR